MFEKFWANIIRYYTNKVPSGSGVRNRREPPRLQLPQRLRGLTQNQGFQPTEVGFVCVAATSSRLGWY
ncbi:hypothetical protein VB735_30620 [Halotia wernerae UHCC 0503]|nr:hypothetical protein [Halotia wernerae UHCC 0503]